MPDEPFTIATGGLPLEGEARDGALTWQTLISADRTPSSSLVVGVAEFPPGGHLEFHRHAPAEFYFCLAGSATVYADDKEMELRPEVAAFIPSGTEHAVRAGAQGMRLLYGFARERFSDVEYDYTGRVVPVGED
jgi:quercetin dioxygenase-like cupin family protein